LEIVDNCFGEVVDNLVKVINPFAIPFLGFAILERRKTIHPFFQAGRIENNENLDMIFFNPCVPFS
jgi:hypothetical protein